MGLGSIRTATGDELLVTDGTGTTHVLPQEMRDTAERVLGLDPASVAARERAARRATTATRRRWLVDDRGHRPAEHLRAVHAALLHRAVPSRYAAPTEVTARPWLDCSLIDIARDLLTLAGDPDPEWGPADGSDTFAPGATHAGATDSLRRGCSTSWGAGDSSRSIAEPASPAQATCPAFSTVSLAASSSMPTTAP